MKFENAPFSDLFLCPQRNGLTRPKRVRGTGFPMVNMGELFAYPRISNVTMDRVPLDKKEFGFVLEAGDLLFARQSLVLEGAGQCSIFIKSCEPTVFESHIIRCRLDKSIADPDFYYYFLKSYAGKAAIGQIVEQGAGASGIRGSDLAKIMVPVPSLAFQQSVTGVLRAMDDRIDLLSQTNTTLEAIAQALFKSWFVDFDPVHAKHALSKVEGAEGREPEAMDAATAALFPSEFVASELGLIPKGWTITPFEREFDFTMGQSPPGSTYNPDGDGLPFFQGCTDFGEVCPSQRIYCTRPTRFAEAGDMLMSVRAPIGALNVASYKCSIGRGLCAVRHKSGSTALTYAYLNALVARIENAAGEGAVFRSLSKKQLASLPVLAPTKYLVSVLSAYLDPLFDRVLVAAEQIDHLSAIRDTLLPRLISGKLRLPEAEAAIEDAMA